MKLMLLLAVAACSSEVDNLVLDSNFSVLESVANPDSVVAASVRGNGWENLPDNWFDFYEEPQDGEIKGSYTIVSPIGQGSVSIEFTIKYEYAEKLFVHGNRALTRVHGVTTKMTKNTQKYLIWQDGGSIVGPVNYQLSVLSPMNTLYLTIHGTLRGEGGFLDPYEDETNEQIQYYANFNINNY